MDAVPGEYAHVDAHLAANLRLWREARTLSQEELAGRMSERGFGFTQSTVWKIEQGRRPVKLAEAVALADALGLRRWNDLTAHPDHVRHEARVQSAHQRASQAYQALKDATAAYLWAQAEVAVAAHEAREAGEPVAELWTSWLREPAERAVLEARAEYDREDNIRMELADAVDAVMAALRERGIDPVIDLDRIVTEPPTNTAGV